MKGSHLTITALVAFACAASRGDDGSKGMPLLQSPRLAPCLDATQRGADLEARLAACERQLGADGLIAEERAVLHGVLGTQYFERAMLDLDAERGQQDLRRGVTDAARGYLGYDRDEGKNCTYPPQTVVLQQKILAPAAPG